MAGFEATSLADAITSKLKGSGLADHDRTFDVGSKLSGLVVGGFDKLGYIPISTAIGQCEGQARYRVEMAIDRQVRNIYKSRLNLFNLFFQAKERSRAAATRCWKKH